ncbi:hypothetical protein MNBD_GAMMA26-53 [hydrothermal vent metagenome]|uniref:DUF2007 domain-containing protein n=1 Tax=hydrothermal vent metagenome TaxID=652676 RepID=A0A3B1BBH4_9ZZZZ
MSALLFRLRNVPDDEADEVRELLTENGIIFYETSAGNWGISLPGIWVQDEAQLPRAKTLIETYQQERLIRVQDEYNQLSREGRARTIIGVMKSTPVRFVAYLAIIALILTISLKPFFDLAN